MNENSVNYGDYSSGHLWLPININDVARDSDEKENATKQRDLYFRYESLTSEPSTSVNRHALSNLKGLLAFRMEKYELSMEHFKSVAQEEPENVNALQNLAHCYAQLQLKSKAEETNLAVRALLGRSELIQVSNKLINHRVACSLAEQAIAYAYDVGMTSNEDKLHGLEEVIEMFDRAINLSHSTLSIGIRRDWFYFMLVVFVRIDKLLRGANEGFKQRRLSLYNRALNIAKDLERSDNVLIRAVSSTLVGILLERQSDFKSTPMSVHDCGYTGVHSLQCYSKAIEIAEKNVQVLNKLSKVFQLNGKHELAIATANMSIEIDESDRNLLPFHIRSKVYTTMYMRDLRRNKTESCVMPDRELLEKAKVDLEKVVRTSPCLRTYVDIGQTCYYMGADAITEELIVDENSVNSALIYFSKALECEMGKSFPELHILRGKCMKIRGEEENALECFKQAAMAERKGSTNTITFHYMIETFINWYCQADDDDRRNYVIEETDQWLQFFLANFDNHQLKMNLKKIAYEKTQQLVQLSRGTIKMCKFTLPKLCFQLFECRDDA